MKNTLIGYARVSTQDQTPALQTDELKKAGCEKIYEDKASGTKEDRPSLQEMLSNLRKGEVVVVWRLDRLGRSLKHLLQIVEELEAKGVGFKSLTEGFDTTTSGGKLIFQIFGALGEFERNLIVERTKAGLEAARARGRKGGRKEKLNDKQVATLQGMYASKKHSIAEIGRTFGISRPTVYRYVNT
jgi:DNA invertase Pin-like site-specific DNA recombinase